MGNKQLVEIVRGNKFYINHKSPQYDRVLEAMERIDRGVFVPDGETDLFAVDYNAMTRLHKTRMGWAGKGLIRRFIDFVANVEDNIDEVLGSAKRLIMHNKDLAYADFPVSIGYGQTCSQPSVVAFMNYLLELEQGQNIFEVGTGCGYSAANILELIGDGGRLITGEVIPQLAEFARANLEVSLGKVNLEKRLKILAMDSSEGFEEDAPYDRICVTAGIKKGSFNPAILGRRLKGRGILVFPEDSGDMVKQIYVNQKLADEIRFTEGFGFVPLIGNNS